MTDRPARGLKGERMIDRPTDLLPCPFCGGDRLDGRIVGSLKPMTYDAWIQCIDCDGSGPLVYRLDTREKAGDEAAKLWNTRAPGWQPIETASKSDRLLVSYVDDSGYREIGVGLWWHDDGWTVEGEDVTRKPTHWRHLPTPPTK